LEGHLRPGTCSVDDSFGGPPAELVEVGKRSTAATSPPKAEVRLLLALPLGWRRRRSVAQTLVSFSEHGPRYADGASELEKSDTGCVYHCGRIRAEHWCVRLHKQVALFGAVSRCLCATKHDALHTLQGVVPVLDRSHSRRCTCAISMDQASSAARAAAFERARAAARERVRRLPAILAQQTKAAEHRRRLAESMRMGMGMAAASEEADNEAPNEISCGICTTDPTASDKAESFSDPTASDEAERFSAIKLKHGLPTVEEVSLYAPDMPTVRSTGAANDKAGPGPTSKEFDGLSSADLAFFDGVSLEISGGSGGMASNNASGAVKRGSDGDVAAPKRNAHKKVKIEKHVA